MVNNAGDGVVEACGHFIAPLHRIEWWPINVLNCMCQQRLAICILTADSDHNVFATIQIFAISWWHKYSSVVRVANVRYNSWLTVPILEIRVNFVKIEAESYLLFTLCEENQSVYSQNPLLFWRDNGKNFPTLQVLAGLFLGMSTGSMAVQSLFFVNGLICNSRRSGLSPATLHKLTFLHDYLDFIIKQCSTSEW